MSLAVETPERATAPGGPRPRGGRRRTSLLAHGEPMVWLTGGSLLLALAMIAGLLLLVFWQGATTFWPVPLVAFETHEGERYLGEVIEVEAFEPGPADLAPLTEELRAEVEAADAATRREVRTGNYELSGRHFLWLSDFRVARRWEPEWALLVERLSWGRFYGEPQAFRVDGETRATSPEEVWALFREHHPDARERFEAKKELEKDDIGRVNRRLEEARLAVRQAEITDGEGSEAWRRAKEEQERVEAETEEEYAAIQAEIASLEEENDRYELVLATADGQEKTLALGDVVRAFPANRLGFLEKVRVYLSRWWEFLSDDPREANTEGGVLPAIFGTVAMTLIMSVVVVPFGVLAALYLREYAKQGTIVSMVRIAVNNLAGVPSIVFGVFGLGFFCYVIGVRLDELWLPYRAKLPTPTYGTGGLLWASLTLALLTLPVVIVATEEALSAVPNSMREGSFACGATKWQTIRRIVLPRAAPGIMTGMILAIARGAGEVAPLMLVGAVKLAPELPIDGVPPFVHPERSFMHLGFHIFDLGFQSPNSEAAKPMVYTTTLLLIALVVLLNVIAVWVRARLRKRFQTGYV